MQNAQISGFPVRVNPHALALDAWGTHFDSLAQSGDLEPFLRSVDAIRYDLGDRLVVHAEPDPRAPGTYRLYDKYGRLSFEEVPETVFVRV